jgi:hypothetical protein
MPQQSSNTHNKRKSLFPPRPPLAPDSESAATCREPFADIPHSRTEAKSLPACEAAGADLPSQCLGRASTEVPKLPPDIVFCNWVTSLSAANLLMEMAFHFGAGAGRTTLRTCAAHFRKDSSLSRAVAACPSRRVVSGISLNGCFIETPNTVTVGSEIELSLEVGEGTHSRVLVRRSLPARGMGIEFTRMTAPNFRRLQSIARNSIRFHVNP